MALAETQFGKFFYFAPDSIGQHIAQGKFWDAHLRPWMDRLTSASVFVDIGSNIGFFTIYCALKDAEVWSFEPSPEVFDLLRRNVELNGVGKKVRLENVALYDSERELKLHPDWHDWPSLPDGKVDYERHGNSGGLSLVPGSGGPYTFTSKTLDSYLLGHCDLVKMDAQGAEFAILHGAYGTIEKHRPVVLFEYEPPRSDIVPFSEFQKFFDGLNYKVDCIGGDGNWLDYAAIPQG